MLNKENRHLTGQTSGETSRVAYHQKRYLVAFHQKSYELLIHPNPVVFLLLILLCFTLCFAWRL